MTRDDIRKLLGGYATGSLSGAERKTLFDAALDDQELFDELAQEHALKELLEEPGVKPRLIAALAPRPRAWWLKPWPWVAVAAAAVVVSIVLLRPPARQEIAEVQVPAPRLEAPPANAPAQPPVPAPAAPPAPTLRRQESARTLPTELRKEPPPQFQDSASDKPEPAKPEPAKSEPAKPEPAKAAEAVQTAAPAAAPAPGAVVVNGLPANGGLIAGAARGGGGGRGGARAAQFVPSPAAAAAAKDVGGNVAARFAFDYSVTPDGRLRIVPSADGFLTVSVSNGGNSTVLLSSQPTQAASTVEVSLPGDSTVARIVFARSAPADETTGLISIDPPSGTKVDPAPSPNSRLQAYIPLTPRE